MKTKETLLIRQHFFDRRSYAGKLLVKTMLFCLGFLIFLPFTLQSQNYLPLVSENKSWTCAWEKIDWQESYSIRLEGDTVIAGIDYKKIIRDMHFYPLIEVIGYIRENSMGRIYSMNTSFEEGLLYDFGATQGDTIHLHNTMMDSWDNNCPFFAELSIVVDTVYTIESMDGISRRALEVRRTNSDLVELWIEGIGSLAGIVKSGNMLFEELSCTSQYMFLWNYLMCYFEDDSLVYYHPFMGDHDCRFYDNINVEETARDIIHTRIIPNPIIGEHFHIQSTNAFEGEIYVFNSLGKLMYKESVQSTEMNIRVPTASLTPGIYVVKLACKNGKAFSVNKVIIN